MMVDLETIIVLASITYIVNLDVYELHLGDEISSKTLITYPRVLHYTQDRGFLLFKSIFVYLSY
jgi:hypothetical protein